MLIRPEEYWSKKM